jgi:hypothetical protein
MKLTLIRDPSDGVRTFGTLSWSDDQVELQTLERPWIPSIAGPGGHAQTSCVPLGVYELVLHDSAAHPKTWALVNPALGVYHQPGDVPTGQTGRTECLIHTANTIAQLAGCIGVGMTRSLLNGEPDVASSVAAFTALKEAVPWIEGHTISIT